MVHLCREFQYWCIIEQDVEIFLDQQYLTALYMSFQGSMFILLF